MRTNNEYVLYRNQLRKLMRVTEKKYHADRIMKINTIRDNNGQQ